MSREWLREDVILLLELYHGFSKLWNVHSSDNKKRNIGIIYHTKIQERLSTTIRSITTEDVKKIFHKLQTQY